MLLPLGSFGVITLVSFLGLTRDGSWSPRYSGYLTIAALFVAGALPEIDDDLFAFAVGIRREPQDLRTGSTLCEVVFFFACYARYVESLHECLNNLYSKSAYCN